MPAKAGGGTGSAKASLPQVDHLVYRSAFARHHVLTDAHGCFAALLCRNTGRLQRLPRGMRA
jgi:hypothetical protein